MSEREGTSDGVFRTPMVVVCALAVTYPRQADIRRRSNELEDALASEYDQPQTVNAPDDAPPELPRFIISSKDGRRGISVSQTSIQMNVLFPDGSPSDLESVAAYVTEHYRETFDALTAIKNADALFFGVSTGVRIPTRLNDAQLLKLCMRSLLKSPDERRGSFDILVKQTRISDRKYYNNVTFANYRNYTLDAPPTSVPRIPMSAVTERGIEVACDFNDRYAYNEKKAYRTSISIAQDIVRYAKESVREAVAQAEAMEE